MIGTAMEIALDMLKMADIHGNKYVYACWDRDDIRCVTGDWDLNNEELNEVMRRFSSCLETGADVSLIHDVVRVMMDERRKKRSVTVPTASLEIIMQLAGKEMERIADGAELGGRSAGLKEEHDAWLTVYTALDA